MNAMASLSVVNLETDYGIEAVVRASSPSCPLSWAFFLIKVVHAIDGQAMQVHEPISQKPEASRSTERRRERKK